MTIAGALVASGALAAGAATTNPNPSSLELSNSQLSKQAATEGMVLLQNNDDALPLAKSSNVALFGVGAYATVKGGTGSGAVNNRSNVNVRQGLENDGFTVTTSDGYWSAMTSAYDTKYPAGSGGGGAFGGGVDYSSVEQVLSSTSVQPSAPTDTALYVIARNSGEGADRKSGQGDYTLTDTEYNDIQLIGQTYQHVVVLINSGGIVDTSFFTAINKGANDPDGNRPLDGLLLMSQAGQQGGNALAEVLDGTVTPSGKLTDTWASKYSYYPASSTFAANDGNSTQENYSEGVYVGYRYFDSFYKTLNASSPDSVVNYPFGYGLSYTNFSIEPQSVTADMDHVTVKAKVTNVGKTYSGKEVVETYFSAPQTGLDKPYQELAGYAKTDDLAPGASQTVTITYDTTEMSSYDESKAAYVMDAGDYVVRVGDSSRNTHVAAKISLASDLVTEQDHDEFQDQKLDAVLTSDPTSFYTYDGEAAEIAAARTVTLSTAGFVPVQAASEYQQDVTVDSSSPYYAIDGDKISSITAHTDAAQTNWEGTGAPYAAKTGETVEHVTTSPSNTLFDVAKGTVTMDQFVAGLSVTQLANIVEGASAKGSTASAVGAAGYTTAKYEKLGIPGLTLSDGPAGLRLTQQIATTPATYQYATAFPVGTMLAQTWNHDLVEQVGEAIGKEMRELGVSLWLAPGMNIHRDPLNGRNFEYYSEDPLVSGLTAAATTEGVQSIPGEGVTIKHFAGNNQETSRSGGNITVDERGFREIELKGFEIAVKSAQPMSVMSSYNRIEGTYAAQDYDTLTNILRGEWGYEGTVMSDWGGSHDATATMYAGNDLIEPGNAPQNIINAIIKQSPTIDVNGMPVYNKTVTTTRTSYTWSFNGITPSATGTQSFATTVDGSTDLSQVPASGTTTVDVINNQTFAANAKFTSVDDAYKQAVASQTNLTTAQKAGVVISDIQYQTAGDTTSPVVSYKVTVRGEYPTTGFPMRLGDLQRSASRVLNTAMQSPQFQQLASLKGVKGVTVKPYDDQFTDLKSYVGVTKGKVVAPVTGQAPKITVAPTTTSATGWYKGTVNVAVTLDDPDTQTAYVSIDGGETVRYTAPVTVTGEGEHQVEVFAQADGGAVSSTSLTVKIDDTKPTVKATSTAGGKLTLKATDALSGVRSVQYSLDNGKTWKTYTTTVTVTTGAPKAVVFRATDQAGNVSATGKATVAGVQTLSTPTIKGTVATKHTVTASVAKHTSGAKLSYQWSLNGKAVKGATKSSYTIPASAKGKRLTVTVTATKTGWTTVSTTSASKTVR
ncbi:glycoside hydrolase family 3 protein [Luteimicrobium subarcticum]|uniref:glycoside hydrolase family 3 protein n=1 Tax=Luteimicrobium subarcticum TaxID=620910 RepID=UPI001B7FFEE6|nr:glycoside hydrolase family 3 protein [Luteimicrobium subarcticum]